MNKIKSVLLIIGVSLSILVSAQTTHVYSTKQIKYEQAYNYFIDESYALAYPIFKELKSDLESGGKSNPGYSKENVDFFYAVCELKLMIPMGENDANNFFSRVNNGPKITELHFHLAHYYYLLNDYNNAITHFDQVGAKDVTKTKLYDLQFEKAYCLFMTKKYRPAQSLFSAVLASDFKKYKEYATYYYGFCCYQLQDYQEALKSFKLVANDPSYVNDVPYYIAEILYSIGQKEEALKYGDSLLAHNFTSSYKKNLQLLTAQLYYERRDYEKALPLYEGYVNANQKVAKEILYELSFCYYKTKNSAKAIEGFKQLSNEKDSMGQNSMYLLGELYLSVNDKLNAKSAFQFCATNSSNPYQQRVSRLNYTKLSYDLGFNDVALVEVKKYIKDYSNTQDSLDLKNPYAHLDEAKEILLSLLTNTNNYDEGLQIYATLNQTSEATQRIYNRLLYGEAIQLYNDQRLDEAYDYLNKINGNKATETINYAKYWKGEIAYQQKKYDEAIGLLEAFVNAKLPAEGEANLKNANYTLGYCWFQKGEYQKALSYFEAVANALKPTSSNIEQDAYVRSADCKYMLSDFTAATAIYENVISSKLAQSDYALFQKAIIAGIKNSNEKIRLLISLTNQFPSSSLLLEAKMETAITYINDQKWSEAIPFLNGVISSPQAAGLKPKAYLNLGLVYYNIEDNKNALTAYKQLIKLYPQSAETDEAIPVIKNIYVEEGKPGEYLDLMAANGIVVDVSEADSLSFTAPFEKYQRKDFVAALDGFRQYVKNFPNGAYVIDANYYAAICCQDAKDVSGAINGYSFVYDKGVGKFYESAALNLGRIYYLELKDYENAKKYFEGLNVNATVQENQLEALRGLVRCYYQLKQYATANKVATDLLNKKGISTDDKAIAFLVLGKSQEAALDSAAAIESFKSVVAINKTSWGAEARYELGACYFAANNLKLSEKAAMSVINETGSYDVWLTKAYILIGDIYMKKKDYFNAKATYESVATNTEIPDLKAEAQRKYDEAVAVEKKSSKIN